MMHSDLTTQRHSRRSWMKACSALAIAGGMQRSTSGSPVVLDRAKVAITLDLEMSRNFPTWETTHWDYEKGNLNEEAKQYALGAAQRVAAAGGRIHFFVVGRVFEQANFDWLKELRDAGHPLGNHTYDHVNVTASRLEDVQFRFARAPWLVAGQSPGAVIQQNIRLCSEAMKTRLGIEQPNGFRTPGGFASGLKEHAAVRSELMSQGYKWISSLYPPHMNGQAGVKPTQAVIDDIISKQTLAQPFRYDDGLVELPMSPISDIGAFRTSRWQVDWFVEVTRQALQWCIDHQAAFDFLAHPSCLGVMDTEFKTIDMILKTVANAGAKAELVTLDQLAGVV